MTTMTRVLKDWPFHVAAGLFTVMLWLLWGSQYGALAIAPFVLGWLGISIDKYRRFR